MIAAGAFFVWWLPSSELTTSKLPSPVSPPVIAPKPVPPAPPVLVSPPVPAPEPVPSEPSAEVVSQSADRLADIAAAASAATQIIAEPPAVLPEEPAIPEVKKPSKPPAAKPANPPRRQAVASKEKVARNKASDAKSSSNKIAPGRGQIEFVPASEVTPEPPLAPDAPAPMQRSADVNKAAANQGTVRIAVSPWALVEVNGVAAGTAPPLTEISLPEGKHQITLRNGDYPPYRTTITVVRGQPTVVKTRFGQ